MAYVYRIRSSKDSMRADIDIERGGDLHERVKEYADLQGVRYSRAYAELIERGLDAADEDEKENRSG